MTRSYPPPWAAAPRWWPRAARHLPDRRVEAAGGIGMMATVSIPWRAATEQALYGERGFFRRQQPAAHFRTSAHVSSLFAAAVLDLTRLAGLRAVVDVGAGGGELLAALHRLDPGLALHGVELADRPPGLPEPVGWSPAVPDGLDGLVVANEWLDDVPVDVVELTADGWRTVLVEPASGHERLGPAPGDRDLEWIDAWWPATSLGSRAEIGWPRDDAWAGVVAALGHGLAVAVDYGHRRGERPPSGTLTGYRLGVQVRPVPDGSCDVTSHVALDACAAAGQRAGATATVLTTQREALQALGVRRDGPPHALSRTDPSGYLQALSERGAAAELTDPAGLGGFGWLVQAVGAEIPQPLTGTAA